MAMPSKEQALTAKRKWFGKKKDDPLQPTKKNPRGFLHGKQRIWLDRHLQLHKLDTELASLMHEGEVLYQTIREWTKSSQNGSFLDREKSRQLERLWERFVRSQVQTWKARVDKEAELSGKVKIAKKAKKNDGTLRSQGQKGTQDYTMEMVRRSKGEAERQVWFRVMERELPFSDVTIMLSSNHLTRRKDRAWRKLVYGVLPFTRFDVDFVE